MLTDVYRRDGVVLTDAFGRAYPEFFVHPVAEYKALASTVGVLDLTHWSIFKVTGNDRLAFLNAMVTNEVAALELNHGCHALMTTIKGKIVAELFVFAREDDTLVFVSQGDAAETHGVLEKHVVMEDVAIEDVSASYGVVAIEGAEKRTEDILWRMFPTGPFPKEHLQAYQREFEEISIFLMKNSVSGETGYHFLIEADHVERLHRYLLQAVRGSDGLPVGRIAWNMRRAENGLPWYGVDFGVDDFPDEVRLGDAVSYEKGCFRGQETLARLRYRGHVNWLLVGLARDVRGPFTDLATAFERSPDNIDEDVLREAAPRAVDMLLRAEKLLAHDAPLFATDSGEERKSIGRITSCVFSPALGRPLALGMVRYQLAQDRADVFTERGERLTQVDLPISP